ncbi:MAG: Hsp33 family molecular chaperone HslO [Alphaproteobacteria bacterium]|nr:Hsp33 family molecular chaperone HslO [Alphaproteobacteria bacterium]
MADANGMLTRAVVGDARALRVDVRAIAEHGADLHGLTGDARAWFVDGLVCATLLSAYLDEGERLTMQVQASEPRFAFTADVSDTGGVRARLSPSDVRGAGHIQGIMLVLKSVVGREVYRGATEVDHPSFAEMLSGHLAQSSQTEARVRVEGGVGAFVERLPDGGDDDLGPVADAVLAGLDGQAFPLRWECSCSDERVLSMLAGLGAAELQAMIDEDHGAVVTCNFCTRAVTLSEDQLRGLL